MIAEIIAIGSELLTPFRQDTNSLYLTEQLNRLGIEVAFKGVVGDDPQNLTDVAKVALQRSNIVILMGGLGPTEDDLTRECVAQALRLELKRDADIAAQLYARFAARRIKMPDNNLRQADLIAGAEWLPNPNGTAPGQWLQTKYEGRPRIVVLLPGPPVELKPMFEAEVLPRLEKAVPRAHIASKVLKLAMLPESEADKRAAPIYMKHFPEVQTTILAAAGEVQLHLRSRAETLEIAQARIEKLAAELEEEFDEAVFSTAGESLEQIVGYFLDMRGATLAVAESCTGGLLAQRLTSVSGSSRYFIGGAVTYANELKTAFADVAPALIGEHGAVSKEVAAAMAEGIRKRCKATLGVGITGVAGPTGGTEEKPVGLVYVAVSDGVSKPEVKQRNWPASRELIRWWSTQMALDMVRRKLM